MGRVLMVQGAILAIGALAAMTNPAERKGILGFLGGWFVPGLGHAVYGQWRKGLVLFGLLAGLYVTGLWITGWRTIAFDDNPFYFIGQFGSAVTWLLGEGLSEPKASPRPDLPSAWFDCGLLYVCVAGLLNVVVIAHVGPRRPPPEGPGASQ